MSAAGGSLTGRTLGDFTIHDKIGEGGYGVVYRAEQRSLGREAVVKVLHARHADGMAGRFLREAQLASTLDHPFAAHIYAFGAEPDGLLWIAMELVRGTTLRKVLEQQPGGRLPIARAVALLDGLCEVVHTAHEQGIVHRDLKPDNVMVLSRAGRMLPKLLDLGIAKRVHADPAAPPVAPATTAVEGDALDDTLVPDRTGDAALTLAGAVLGSPYYMAPEQWQESAEVDARTDIYALGVLTYEMISGKPPFSGTSLPAIAHAHRHDAVPPLPAEAAALDPVLRRALAKSRDERFPTALAFAEALRAASGMRMSSEALPRLDDELRAELAWMPQPIADAVGVLEAARNPHQARDAMWGLVGAVVRWMGVVALAARTRLATAEAPGIAEKIRELLRRDLSDAEWLALVADLVRPFAAIRDAYPVPELVTLALATPSPFAPVLAMKEQELVTTTEESLRDHLARTLPVLSPLLRAVTFFANYQLVVPRGDRAEVWMGTRRSIRPVIAIPPGTTDGTAVLADLDGKPILQLAPLVQVGAPAPGADDELFVFVGPGRARSGARMLSSPHGFERHDDALWEWFRAHHLAVDGDAPPALEEAPYRGLQTFTERDAALFFGRERAVEAFVNRLLVEPMLVVVGPSGVGKSSFVRAGVIPALPKLWRAVVMRPGATPSVVLASLDLAVGPGETVVLVVDQVEELFTLCHDAAERERFVTAVLASDVKLVLTVRDDFLARVGELAGFRDRLSRAVTLLATPDDADLIRIVTEPARRAGYDLEGDLAARIIREVAGQPGALALLSFTAARLWELRDRHFKRLVASAYAAIGGVQGALAQHAEETLKNFTTDEQRVAREAFRHLATAEGTRAVLTKRELHEVLGGSTAVIDRLVEARLVVIADGIDGDEQVEVVHEALFSAWPRLVEWRREDAEGARMRDQLRTAARQWHDRGRPSGLLWRDEALDEYVRWRAKWTGALPETDDAFGNASVADARRRRLVRRSLVVGSAVVLVSAVIGLAVLNSRARALADDKAAALTRSQIAEGAKYLVDGDYLAALEPLATAYADGDRSDALRLMLHRAMRLAGATRFSPQHVTKVVGYQGTNVIALGLEGDAVLIDPAGHVVASLPAAGAEERHGTAVTADGALAAVSHDDAVELWDGRTTRTIPVAHVRLAAFDDAGHLALQTEGDVSVWDTATGNPIWRTAVASRPAHLAWCGSVLITVATDRSAKRIDHDAVTELPAAETAESVGADSCAAFGPDGVRVYDAAGVVIREIAIPAISLAVTRDHQRFAIGTQSGAVLVVDAKGRAERTLVGHHGPVNRARFTRDGTRLVTAASDNTVWVWDVLDGAPLVHYVGLSGTPIDLELSADEQWIGVGTTDGVHQYPIADPSITGVIDAGDLLGAGQVSDDGSLIVVVVGAAGVGLWDGGSLARRGFITTNVFDGAHISPDRSLVAIPIDGKNEVELRSLPDGALRGTLRSDRQVFWAAFDAQRIATGNANGTIEIWSHTGERLATLRGHRDVVQTVTWSPDGRLLASASNDMTARVWDVAAQREVAKVSHEDEVFIALFDASGTRLVTASNDRTVKIWDLRTPEQPAHVLVHESPVRTVAIDPSGTLVAAGTRDGSVQVWDIATGRPIARMHHGAAVQTTQFTARGLFTTSFDHHAMFWDIGTDVPDPEAVTAFARCHAPSTVRETSRISTVPGACR